MIIWFTGQPGAGKTTMAKKLYVMYSDYMQMENVIHLDGDDLRSIMDNQDYSDNGRRKNISFAMNMAKVLSNKNYIVIVSMVSPFLDMREELKSSCDVIEFYLTTTEVRGREKFFCDDYEPPKKNFTLINTDFTEEETFDEILHVCRSVAAVS
jgi:adenylylsulfate kinase-like enzyme|tara:strand:+ start:320 stop:778 length:459 start_codon:yes stop_codon:yes gene_type:complete